MLFAAASPVSPLVWVVKPPKQMMWGSRAETILGRERLSETLPNLFLDVDILWFWVKVVGNLCVESGWCLCCWPSAITSSTCSELPLLCVNAKCDLLSLSCCSCLIQSSLYTTVSLVPATCFYFLSGFLSISVQKKGQKEEKGRALGAEPQLQAKWEKYVLRRGSEDALKWFIQKPV